MDSLELMSTFQSRVKSMRVLAWRSRMLLAPRMLSVPSNSSTAAILTFYHVESRSCLRRAAMRLT